MAKLGEGKNAPAARGFGGYVLMDALLILRQMRVENANAITGLTWGFPAISNFLGFVHALSRKLPSDLDLEGCGVICHSHQVQAHQPRGWGDYVFALSRNPVTKEGKSPSFVEEGRLHATLSLLIPVAGDIDDEDDRDELLGFIEQLVFSLRLAGGTIMSIGSVELIEPPEDYEGLQKFERRQLRRLLPGFALVLRSDLLAQHTKRLRAKNSQHEAVDAWLDFSALKYEATRFEGDGGDEQPAAEWHHVPRPAGGWLVPIAVGYRAISDLYEPGAVARNRDPTTPFRFVESVYSVGEWVSPHRVSRLDHLIWCYDTAPESGWYLCRNSYEAPKAELS